MSKKIKVFLLACVLAIICCMGFTVGATDEASAEVKGHSLTITDTGISVNFYVVIQGDVQVTLNENEVDLSTAEKKEVIIDAKAYDCYVFTQAVVAKEMDDKVTLSILSGNTELVNDSYCVNDYVAEVQKGGYNYNFETLANAMTYYGEFAEVYFGYKGATSASANANSYISDVTVANFESYAASVNTANMPDGLGFYGTMLNLNSKTTLRLLFTVEGKEPSSFGTFTANGKDLGELKPYREYYYVDIEGIGAAELDKAYTIKCGDAEIISNCSVLTYAGAAVKSTKESLVNLSKALYLYNQKADTYVGGQAYAVYDMFYGNDGFSATPGTRTAIYLTANGDVTRQASGNTEITSLDQLSGSRTKGFSVWMETAYTVSGTESLTGPYVIRRYTENTGNLLNVEGTATLTTTVDRSTGDFVAQYPGNKDDVTINELAASEVSASGTLNVTGSAKTGVITVASDATANIVANDLVSKDQVILASHKGVNLSGNADVSAIKLLDDGMGHFDIVKHNNNVRVASVICVCGDDVTGETSHEDCPWAGENGISAVYDIDWRPHTATSGTVPGTSTSGYYYLTNNLTASRSDVYAQSYLDLNGWTITTDVSAYWTIRLEAETANYSITDSKENGTIQFPKNYDVGAWGSMISFTKAGTFSIYDGTIDMSNASEVEYTMIDVNSGKFFMHGGDIKGAQSKIVAPDGYTYSNCIRTRNSGTISVTGGTIYGDVLLQNASDTLEIGEEAQVGCPLEGSTISYGIYTWNSETSVICNNLNENAQIYVQKDSANIALSEAEDSNSLASVFTLVNEGKDGHYGVVKKSDGTLAFATTICVCGENVSDNHDHTCAWSNVQADTPEDRMEAVYGITWQAHTTSTGLPGLAKGNEACYYLETDVTLTGNNFYTAEGTHLDLNGKSVICAYAGGVNIRTNSGTSQYSISDSKGTGEIRVPENFSSNTNGAVIQVYNTGAKFIMYSGTIDMTNATVSSSDGNRPIEICGTNTGGNNFIMYGGMIKPSKTGHSVHVRGQSHLNVLGDGKIYGRVEINPSEENIDILRVGGSAKVGRQWENIAIYGIRQSNDYSKNIVCDNLNQDAQIVLLTKDNLILNEKENSNSVLTGIKTEDGHYGVIKESGSLRFVSVICVCGEDVTGKDSHTCAWTGTEKDIADVYNINWKAYDATTGVLPGSSEAGFYYLTNNLTANRTDVIVESYLDLNGYTVTLAGSQYWTLRIEREAGKYSVTDSKGTGTIKFPENYAVGAWGAMVLLKDAGTFNMYGGTIDMTNAAKAPYSPIEINGGHLFMHGGVIKGAQSMVVCPDDGTTYTNCIRARGTGTVTATGGSIYGEILLQTSANTLTVSGAAQVGLATEDIVGNGIKAWADNTPIISTDLTDNAKILFASDAHLQLSEGFELVDKDGELLLQRKVAE